VLGDCIERLKIHGLDVLAFNRTMYVSTMSRTGLDTKFFNMSPVLN
jgi:hypothetical protein